MNLNLKSVVSDLLARWGPAALTCQAPSLDPQRMERTRRQCDALVTLATNESNTVIGSIAAAQRITEISADALDVQRVSVWELSEDCATLHCVDCFEPSSGNHTKGTVLETEDYPRYFAALAAGRAVDANDARSDPRTNEFRDGYLIPLGITSMLDSPIRIFGKVVGAVCHEHVGPMRCWTDDEVSFAAQIADQMAHAYVDEEQRRIRQQLRAERDLSVGLNVTPDLDQALELCLGTAMRLTNMECGGIYLVQQDGSLRLHAHEGLSRQFITEVEHYAWDTPSAARAVHGTPLFARHGDDTLPQSPAIRQEGLKTVAILPIRQQGDPIACLNLASSLDMKIPAPVRHSLESLTNQMGSAIVRIRAQEELRKHSLELESTNAELHAAKAAAEFATHSKDEFLANMSHEIRTPMTAILGFAELLGDSVSDPVDRDAVATILRNGKHLLTLINDILDLSKIEAGQLQFDLVDCSPNEIVREVVHLMRVKSEEKGLELRVHSSGAIPQTIRTDPTRLRQILVNLVGNAIKFTHTGRVQMSVRAVESANNVPVIQFDVVDSGIGIPKEKIDSIFEPFAQADSSTTRHYGGTGLGLAISRRLAQLLGGNVSATSTVGEGSVFRVTIATGETLEAKKRDKETRGPVTPRKAPAITGRKPAVGNRTHSTSRSSLPSMGGG